MSNFKKLMMTAAGGEALNVEDVFSTYLYDGTSATRTITNGIDLSTEGGLIWTKQRNSSADDHWLVDTERGVNIGLKTNSTQGSDTGYSNVTSFNTDGYSLGTQDVTNESPFKHVSWTFRKAPKFFDVVTYTGNDTAGTTISHNLGVQPAVIIVKSTSATGNWVVYHRSNGAGKYMYLNTTAAAVSDTTRWNNTEPTATEFTVGAAGDTNYGGRNYVAYLFAHNDGDGDFGPTGDQDIIKCGSYTGSNSQELNIGFEPQWIMIKRTDVASDWVVFDNMRGMSDTNNRHLRPNNISAEISNSTGSVMPTTQGIKFDANTISEINSGGDDFIYIAIRRGPMAVPESATDVFDIDTRTAVSSVSGTDPSFSASFPADMALWRTVDTAANNLIASRLTQSKLLYTNLTNAQGSSTNGLYYFDKENGWYSSTSSDPDSYSWMWRRAPNFFDVVAYTGTGSEPSNKAHNLGAVPEMIWIKRRNSASDWNVYHKDLGNTHVLRLNLYNASQDIDYFADTTPTETQFTTSNSGDVNASGSPYIAYLFASLDGISKVGSYTGNGTNQNIDCGFSAGARFVLIKGTNVADWYLFDSERGIVAGGDPVLHVNSTLAEISAYDAIDPYSGGFKVNQVTNLPVNVSGQTYIYYAIA